jgi:acetolactate synthase I/II/III large subunit
MKTLALLCHALNSILREFAMNAAEVIVNSLEKHGVEYVFAVPGGAIEPLNNALHTSPIKVIVAKHEAGAAFMADGYARVSGNIGVCCSTSGPGATNMITGIASAFGDSIPVIALTGQVATSLFGTGAVQELTIQSFGIVSIYSQISKYSDIIINENKAGEMISKARRLALTGRKGPVHLNLPTDIMKREAADGRHVKYSTTQAMGFDREGVKAAAKLLLCAKKPVILAGWGTVLSRADVELQELAELMDIPVATSPKAKGIMRESHPLSLGVMGFAGSPATQEYIIKGEVDVMLAIGTSFNEWVTSGWDRRLPPMKSLIQIDIDYDEIGKNYFVDVGIGGDARIIMRELIYELHRQLDKGGTIGDGRRKEVHSIKKNLAVASVLSDSMPYNPQRVIMDLAASLPQDTLYFADNGNSMAWAIRYLTVTQPYSFFIGLGFASMGFATSAAIGGKLAAGDRPVVALVGDGSFLMNGMEVATAVNYNIPVIWVVMNNSMLGMVYHGRKLASLPEGIESTFKQVDFVKLAEGLGARGIRITKPGEINREMMTEIISAGVPTVLDVIIDPEAVPPIHSRISSLEKLYT